MATLYASNPLGLVELAKRSNNGQLLEIAEVMDKTNDLLKDAVFVEANDMTCHKGTVRTNLPAGTWRRFNGGVAATASQTEKVSESIGMLENYSELDVDEVKIAPNPQQFRQDEDTAFFEGMAQDIASAVFFGNQLENNEKFTGLYARYGGCVAGTPVGGASIISANANIISAGGSAANSSIWIIQWGRKKVSMIYPRGGSANLITHRDLGESTKSYTSGSSTLMLQVMRSHFQAKLGLFVHDTRCVKRICNVPTGGDETTKIENYIIKALNKMPYGGAGAVIYCNSDVQSLLEISALRRSNVLYYPVNWYGEQVLSFRGKPIRRCDAIGSAETTISS